MRCDGSAAGAERRTSIWPEVEERVLDLVEQHRSTIVFANSRRLAERLTARLNEIAYERRTGRRRRTSPRTTRWTGATPGSAPRRRTGGTPGPRPARRLGAGTAAARRDAGRAVRPGRHRRRRPVVVARAHHGSVSKEQRALVEEDLKSGRLPAVVATSSLELGIDMGAVDLVVQVESPPSVATGLQRVGRAGHQVGAVAAG